MMIILLLWSTYACFLFYILYRSSKIGYNEKYSSNNVPIPSTIICFPFFKNRTILNKHQDQKKIAKPFINSWGNWNNDLIGYVKCDIVLNTGIRTETRVFFTTTHRFNLQANLVFHIFYRWAYISRRSFNSHCNILSIRNKISLKINHK